MLWPQFSLPRMASDEGFVRVLQRSECFLVFLKHLARSFVICIECSEIKV